MKKFLPLSRINLLVISLFFFVHHLSAQQFEREHFPVSSMGQDLSNAWTGGMNTPQFSEIDLNNDSLMDLYVFDRVGHVHMTFINEGSVGEVAYTYAPEYTKNFPDCEDWVAMRDYNGDGIMDIFTQHSLPDGIKAYRGFINDEQELDFEPYNNIDCSGDFLCIDIGAAVNPNIYCAYVDYPAIVDVDKDGDLDILNFDAVGTYVVFYENYSTDPEVMKFRIEDYCWGGFAETALSQTILMNLEDSLSCFDDFLVGDPDEANTSVIHPGSSILAFDEDLDNDLDVLIGDVTNENMVFLRNNDSCENAWMTEQDPTYPSYDVPIEVDEFPMAYYMDFDNDGIKDLMATNNATSSIENYYVSWFYKSSFDEEGLKKYNLESTSIFTDQQIDFGSGSSPAVFDYNADGLLDILVGTYGYQLSTAKDPRLVLFENTGTATEPSFEIVDFDYLGFSTFAEESWLFAPAFGDMDADGDVDLLVGESGGKIFYCENTAGAGNTVVFANPIYDWKSIDVGQRSKPFVIDLDRDGDNDLVIGEHLGNLNYIKNTGTPEEFQCDPDQNAAGNNSSLGEVSATTGEPNDIIGNSIPFFLDVDGHYEMILGTRKGTIRRYSNIDNNIEPMGMFDLLNNELPVSNIGNSSTPHFADLNNDGFLDMIIGNDRGGLQLYATDLSADYIISKNNDLVALDILDLSVYPNPGSGLFNVSLPAGEKLDKLVILDALGKVAFEFTENKIDIRAYPSGVYTVLVYSESGRRGQVCLVKD